MAAWTTRDFWKLQNDLRAERARVAELETECATLRAQLADRPAAAAAPVKRRTATRRAKTDACQYCGDTSQEKSIFLGLPMCNGGGHGWKRCASRVTRARNAGKIPGYAYDTRYSVKRETFVGETYDGPWVARFDGAVIAINPDRGAARQAADAHRTAELTAIAA